MARSICYLTGRQRPSDGHPFRRAAVRGWDFSVLKEWLFSCPLLFWKHSPPPNLPESDLLPGWGGVGQPGEAGERSRGPWGAALTALPAGVQAGWFAYLQVIASQAGGSCICEYRSPQSLTRQTHGHRDSHTDKVAWGGGIPPCVNVQHTRARVGYWTWPEGPGLGSSCPLR